MKTLNDHIEITPGTCGGKPRIAGRRISVMNVAIWHEKLGMSVDEFCAGYNLAPSDVHAALTYYFDHREAIEEEIRRSEAIVDEATRRFPSKLAARLRLNQLGE